MKLAQQVCKQFQNKLLLNRTNACQRMKMDIQLQGIEHQSQIILLYWNKSFIVVWCSGATRSVLVPPPFPWTAVTKNLQLFLDVSSTGRRWQWVNTVGRGTHIWPSLASVAHLRLGCWARTCNMHNGMQGNKGRQKFWPRWWGLCANR